MNNAEIHVRAHRGIAALSERQKAMVKEHTERKKRLAAVMDAIAKGDLTGELQLDANGFALSPEMADLLENPTHGL